MASLGSSLSQSIRWGRFRVKLAAPITAVQTTITVESGMGALISGQINFALYYAQCFLVEGDNYELVNLYRDGGQSGDNFLLDRNLYSEGAFAFSADAELICAPHQYWVRDATKVVWDLNIEVSGKANLSSPSFSGTPTAPTAADGTNTTQLATTAFVQNNGGLAVQQGKTVNNIAVANNTVYNPIGTLTVLTIGTVPLVFGNQWLTIYGFDSPLTRYYRFKAKAKFAPTAGGVRKAWLIRIADSVETEVDFKVITGATDNEQTIYLETPIMRIKESGSYNVNDKMELRVFQDSGAPLNLLPGSYIECERLK